MPDVHWNPFDYSNKAETAPKTDAVVWIVEESYEEGVTLGLFDGYTFRVLPSGSDDCSVSAWASIEYPEPPAGESTPDVTG